MADAIDIARKVLVGRVRGRTYSVEILQQWIKEIWGTLLKELRAIKVLERGWFALHFHRAEYTEWILSQFWHIELAPILLKRWDPLFDPEHEQLGAGPIWVRLPGLPMQFLTLEVFKRIGDVLGTYLEHDQSYERTGIMNMARILVHLDNRAGLEEKITLHRRHFSHKQHLDYEGVPFRCRRCHKVGHLYKDCPLLSGVTSENSRGTKQQPLVEQNKGDMKQGEGDLNQSEIPSVAGNGASKKTNSRQKAVSSPPRTHSKYAVEASSTPGNESLPITSALFLDVNFSILHSSLHPPSSVPGSIPSLPCSIAPPPSTFSTTPSSLRMTSSPPPFLPP